MTIMGHLGSMMGTLMFIKAMYSQIVPLQWQQYLNAFIVRHTDRVFRFMSPYITIAFDEYTGEGFDRCEIFTTIQTYLSENCSAKAKALKACSVDKGGKGVALGLSDNQQVSDEFEGVEVWWHCSKYHSSSQSIKLHSAMDDKRYYSLSFHNRHRKLITESYLRHVLEQGRAISMKKRQRKLYTNVKESSMDGYKLWNSVHFKHPATFDTLALLPTKKEAIITDLVRFSKAKDYYKKIGKPWKRGYLLYGPPGTGKSTMIAAIANLLDYDIYDLELTAVQSNTQLRKLLNQTSGKSIIVIEDIDCSLDLTGQRSEKKEKGKKDKVEEESTEEQLKKKLEKPTEETKKSAVTLSGLLNFIDGIWSACGQEKIIVFTTNYIDKLDPALIRRGRMDMHIELSYCCFEAFKMLARNYLNVETHLLFDTIKRLLEETQMTPADVAENLMPKSLELDVDASLENVVSALEKSKEEARLKAQEEQETEEKDKLAKDKKDERSAN